MMNKKQKMKAALDNLFTTPNIKEDEGAAKDSHENPKPSQDEKTTPVEGMNQVTLGETPAEILPVVDHPVSPVLEEEVVIPQPEPVEMVTSESEQETPSEKPTPVEQPPAASEVPEVIEPIRAPEITPAVKEVPKKAKGSKEVSPSKEAAAVSTESFVEKPQETEVEESIERQLVIFQLCGEFYGFEIEGVESIIKMQPITIVPHTPNYIRGVTNLRGTVLPVLDLRSRFELPHGEITKDSRIIVIKNSGSTIGVIVDCVTEVVHVQSDQCEPTPSISMTVDSQYIAGIARYEDRLIILLNLEKILTLNKENR